jgi:hypothetical protein
MMPMKTLFRILPLVLLLAGCTFTQHSHIAWLDSSYTPKSGQSVFDLMNQPQKAKVEIYRNGTVPNRSYHPILMLSVAGNGNQEPDAVETFTDLSARAGADAVLIARPTSGLGVRAEITSQTSVTNNVGSEKGINQSASGSIFSDDLAPNRRYLFSATAVVWDSSNRTQP